MNRGPRYRPQPTTGIPEVDRALREMGKPADLGPTLAYDKNGRLVVSDAVTRRLDALEDKQPPHLMRTAADDTGGSVLPTLAEVSGTGDDVNINNALATLQAQLDRLHAILVERGMVQ